MAAVVGAEAFKTGMETGLIPNSHVAPGTPPQPHSTANVAAKPSNCAALGMARARPIAFLRHLDNVAAHTCAEDGHDGGCAKMAVSSVIHSGPRAS